MAASSAARSAFRGLRGSSSLRPAAGPLYMPTRSAQYSAQYREPIGTDREELKAVMKTPEGNPRSNFSEYSLRWFHWGCYVHKCGVHLGAIRMQSTNRANLS